MPPGGAAPRSGIVARPVRFPGMPRAPRPRVVASLLGSLLASLDGRTVVRTVESGPDAATVGVAVARTILDDLGGAALLAAPVPPTPEPTP